LIIQITISVNLWSRVSVMSYCTGTFYYQQFAENLYLPHTHEGFCKEETW